MGVTVFLLRNNYDQTKFCKSGEGWRRGRSETRRVVATHLLLNLELVHDRRKLREDLVRLLVVLELCGDELGKVAERLGGVEDLAKG